MNNPKLALAERERAAYICGATDLAKFFGELLDYVAELEEEINHRDLAISDLESQKTFLENEVWDLRNEEQEK